MNSKMYIPKTIKVGFQERSDTYTGKLAYVVYIDEKGVTRKETSWDSWRDKKIDYLTLENTPKSSFVLNKGVQRSGSSFGSGRSVVRVHDERDFEFEITVDNLIGILMHSDVYKRDIQEECIYAWSGKDLVLLPTNSEQYKESVEFTEKQAKKLSTKDFIKGHIYSQKSNDSKLVYIGYENWCTEENHSYNRFASRGTGTLEPVYPPYESRGKKHVFQELENKYSSDWRREFLVPATSRLAERISIEPVSDYAKRFAEFEKSENHQLKAGIALVPLPKKFFSKLKSSVPYNRYDKYRMFKEIAGQENKFLLLESYFRTEYGTDDILKRKFGYSYGRCGGELINVVEFIDGVLYRTDSCEYATLISGYLDFIFDNKQQTNVNTILERIEQLEFKRLNYVLTNGLKSKPYQSH